MLNVACAPGQKFVREPRTHHYRPSFNVYKCQDDRWLQVAWAACASGEAHPATLFDGERVLG